jgi:CO/xanthine dehydrogenase FAD-binding subunit
MRADAAEYELVRPGSLAGVLALLAEAPGEYMAIAGGTELMVQFGAGRLRARRLVDIFGLLELTGVAIGEDEITIGAGVTYTSLRRHPVVARELPLLALAASWTGAPANQNRGTVGGNVVNGSPAADTPPALLAYGAEVSLVSVRGTRRLSYCDFHTGYKQSVLAADELVLALHLPRTTYARSYLRKVGARKAQAISKVALGAVANVRDGLVCDCRIGLASVAAAPFRCYAAEAAVNGFAPGAETLARARAALLGEIAPLDDIRSTGAYRAHVAGNLLEEFLTELDAL